MRHGLRRLGAGQEDATLSVTATRLPPGQESRPRRRATKAFRSKGHPNIDARPDQLFVRKFGACADGCRTAKTCAITRTEWAFDGWRAVRPKGRTQIECCRMAARGMVPRGYGLAHLGRVQVIRHLGAAAGFSWIPLRTLFLIICRGPRPYAQSSAPSPPSYYCNPRTRSTPQASLLYPHSFFCAERDTFAPSIIVSSLQSQIASLLPSMSSVEQQAPVPAAATTPQQQPLGTPTQQSAPTPASVANSSGDQLVCQWQSCGERLPSAEQLYVSLHTLLLDRYTD